MTTQPSDAPEKRKLARRAPPGCLLDVRNHLPYDVFVAGEQTDPKSKRYAVFTHRKDVTVEQLREKNEFFIVESEDFLRSKAPLHGVAVDKHTMEYLATAVPAGKALNGANQFRFHRDEVSGALIALYVLPPGYDKAAQFNMLCHWCGALNAVFRCPRCQAAVYCDDRCLLAAQTTRDLERRHTRDACVKVHRVRIAAAAEKTVMGFATTAAIRSLPAPKHAEPTRSDDLAPSTAATTDAPRDVE